MTETLKEALARQRKATTPAPTTTGETITEALSRQKAEAPTVGETISTALRRFERGQAAPSAPPTRATIPPSPDRPSLLGRFGRTFINSAILNTLERGRPDVILAKGLPLIKETEKELEQAGLGRRIERALSGDLTPEEQLLVGGSGRSPAGVAYRVGLLFEAVLETTIRSWLLTLSPRGQELRRKGEEEFEQARAKREGLLLFQPIFPLGVPKAENLKEMGVDIGAGVSAFLVQLFLAKKLIPRSILVDSPKPLVAALQWEIVNEASGGFPGKGALMGATLSALQGIEATSAAIKAGKIAGPSVLFAGMTAAEGGDLVDVVVSAIVPLALHGLGAIASKLKQRVIGVKTPEALRKAVAQARVDALRELGIRTNNPSFDQIKKAFRKRARDIAGGQNLTKAEVKARVEASLKQAIAARDFLMEKSPIFRSGVSAEDIAKEQAKSAGAEVSWVTRDPSGKVTEIVLYDPVTKATITSSTTMNIIADVEAVRAKAKQSIAEVVEEIKAKAVVKAQEAADQAKADLVSAAQAARGPTVGLVRPGLPTAPSPAPSVPLPSAVDQAARVPSPEKKPAPEPTKPLTGPNIEEAKKLLRRTKLLKFQITQATGDERKAIVEKLKVVNRTLRDDLKIDKVTRARLLAEIKTAPRVKPTEPPVVSVKDVPKRPAKIGRRVVITPITEAKVSSLITSLKRQNALNDTELKRVMDTLKIKVTKFESPKSFLTEKQGTELITALNAEAPAIKERLRTEGSLKVPENLGLAIVRDRVRRTISKKAKPDAPVQYPSILAARYVMGSIQSQTGGEKPFYHRYQNALTASRDREAEIHKVFNKLSKLKDYKKISRSKESSQRISDYIESHLPRSPTKVPKGITPEEIAVAKEIQSIEESLQNLARLHRFEQWVQDPKQFPIPNAPKADLARAKDIFEAKGRDALKVYLDTKTWGVILKGYMPRDIIGKGRELQRSETISVGRGDLRVRVGPPFVQDRTIFQRLRSQLKRVYNRELVVPEVQALARLHDATTWQNPADAKLNMENQIRELLGYPASTGMAGRVLRRTASHVIRVLFLKPDKWLRNLHQFFAFDPNRLDLLDPRGKSISPADLQYFEDYVNQLAPFREQFLMQEELPFFLFRHVSRWLDKINLYPLTDVWNRRISYRTSLNVIRIALKDLKPNDSKSVERFLRRSGIIRFEPFEQEKALEILATDGPDAMARWAAAQHVLKIQFAYERSQRSPIEMGSVGRILGSLFTFPRSWAEQAVLSAKKIRTGRTWAERWKGLVTAFGSTFVAFYIGKVYQLITGRKDNPYYPIRIFRTSPGGLVTGSGDQISELLWDVSQAISGDEASKTRATKGILRAARMGLPGYEHVINIIDALADIEGSDKLAVAELRRTVEEGDKLNRLPYIRRRTWVQLAQKALFGGKKADLPVEALRNLASAFRRKDIDDDNLDLIYNELSRHGYKTGPQILQLALDDIEAEKLERSLKLESPKEDPNLRLIQRVQARRK